MAEVINVLALTKYGRLAASSRHRFYDYFPLLERQGVAVTAVPLLSNSYVERLYDGQSVDLLDIASAFMRRLLALSTVNRFDVIWLEAELFPRFPAIFERILTRFGCRLVVDLDDAIFHTYDRHPYWPVRTLLNRKIDVVLARASAVLAGNNYIADRARQSGARRVVLVPTTVDVRVYERVTRAPGDQLTFGWIGSPATAHYLRDVQPELERLCQSLQATLRLIGAGHGIVASPRVVLRPWSEQSEIDELAACDIGLAPLSDGPWERGKCGVKAIQYMAAGLPVLAARVGALQSIVVHGETGFLYSDGAEFAMYASRLAGDRELRERMGKAGRQRAANCYSLHQWSDTIRQVLADSAA